MFTKQIIAYNNIYVEVNNLDVINVTELRYIGRIEQFSKQRGKKIDNLLNKCYTMDSTSEKRKRLILEEETRV